MIVIVNYGLGNLGSIENMLKKIDATNVCISNKEEDILKAEKLILPGVGAFDAGMQKINESGLLPILNKAVIENKTPILGICLGMQLMTQKSEEGNLNGLNWIDAECIKFKFEDNKIKVPHMGWNYIDILETNLKNNLPNPSKYYFVHSYYVKCNQPENELIYCNYGHQFVAGFKKANIMGVQFHPEKSHKYGMQLMRFFVEKFK